MGLQQLAPQLESFRKLPFHTELWETLMVPVLGCSDLESLLSIPLNPKP